MKTHRRSFFKLIAAATAAVAMDVMGIKPFTAPTVTYKAVVNEAYRAAPFEMKYIFHPRVLKAVEKTVKDDFPQWPRRYNLVNGKYQEVSPFIYEPVEVMS